MKQHQIYLSRRNLLTLLSKLDRQAAGDATACAIIKYKNPADPYCNTIDQVVVTAVADEEFYANRAPGVMHPLDEANL
jgi:hypothetical protein